uniref:Cpp2 n=1 Tax=Campylobacter coli TaxID=195 RepID=Q69BI4_CAMCO|nr:cpp2 [Campylobacter coli]
MMKCEWILCPVCGSKTRNRHCFGELSPLLSKMQTRKID